MTARSAAIVVAVALGAIELIRIALLCALLGPTDGLVAVMHDPGKGLFHLLVLPAAAGVLINSFPYDDLRKIKPPLAALLVLVGSALAFLSFCFAIWDVHAAFDAPPTPPVEAQKADQKPTSESQKAAQTPSSGAQNAALSRVPVPWDFHDKQIRDALWGKWQRLHENLTAPSEPASEPAPAGGGAKESGKNDSSAEREAAARAAQSKAAIQQYLGEVAKQLPNRSVWADSSWATMVSLVETVLGVWTACLVLVYLGVYACAKQTLNEESRVALVLVIALLSVWFILRGYSEWYNNFGLLQLNRYPGFTVAGSLAVICVALVFFLGVPPTRRVIIPTALATGTFVGWIAALVVPKTVESVFRSFAALPDIGLRSVYCILVVGSVFLMVYYLGAPNDGAPAEPPRPNEFGE